MNQKLNLILSVCLLFSIIFCRGQNVTDKDKLIIDSIVKVKRLEYEKGYNEWLVTQKKYISKNPCPGCPITVAKAYLTCILKGDIKGALVYCKRDFNQDCGILNRKFADCTVEEYPLACKQLKENWSEVIISQKMTVLYCNDTIAYVQDYLIGKSTGAMDLELKKIKGIWKLYGKAGKGIECIPSSSDQNYSGYMNMTDVERNKQFIGEAKKVVDKQKEKEKYQTKLNTQYTDKIIEKGNYVEGIAWFKMKNPDWDGTTKVDEYKYGFITENGDIILPPLFICAVNSDFKNGYACITVMNYQTTPYQQEKKCIDKTGQLADPANCCGN